MYLYAHGLLILRGVGHLVSEDVAIVESDTLGEGVHIGTCERLVEGNLIYLLLTIRGVCQLTCDVAIVGYEKEAQRVLIETSYGVNTLGAGILHKVHDRLVGMGVVKRCDIPLRLVEHDIYVLLTLKALIVEAHLVGGEYLCAELRYDNAIYRNNSREDEVISLTT